MVAPPTKRLSNTVLKKTTDTSIFGQGRCGTKSDQLHAAARDKDEPYLLSLATALKCIKPQHQMACKLAIMKVISDHESAGTNQRASFAEVSVDQGGWQSNATLCLLRIALLFADN